jgi:uroporphyrin-III C-methyltransferase
MSDTITTPENNTSEVEHKPRRSWAKFGIWLCFLGLLILLGAFGYGYVELARVNMALAQQLDQIEKIAKTAEKNVSTLQNDVQTLQQNTDKAEALSAKQEQLMAAWEAAQKGSMVKWQLAEANYLIRLAQDELQITHNPVIALTLLQRAEEVLKNSDDQIVLPIRQSLATNITQLQAASSIDTTSLYIRVNSLMELITQLPFPATPLAGNSPTTPADTSQMSWCCDCSL